MPTPAATICNMTATGDVITGPGAGTTLIKGLPVACLGDMVTGPMCVGAISVTTAITKLAKGRPTANLTSVVNGVNPILGFPMVTMVAVCPNVNVIL